MLPKFTRIRSNTAISYIALITLQVFILWEINGELSALFRAKDLDILGMVFGPTIALVWVARKDADLPPIVD